MRLIVVFCAALAAGPAWAGPSFVERAGGFDFTHEYTGGWEHFVGGGVAVFDCNGDFLPDLYVAGGEGPARLLVNRAPAPGAAIWLADETPEELALDRVIGAYPIDVDSDGQLDLVVLRAGVNRIMLGEGDCRFRGGSEALGFLSDDWWSTAFSATWEPGARLPVLAIGNYVDRADPDGPFEACDINQLYRPEGGSYWQPIELSPGHCALSMLFSDWGRSGRQDLRISNDRHYYVKGGFEEMWRLDATPRPYTEADGWPRLSIWGMGIASRDITGDGLPEVYLTSMGDQVLQFREPDAPGPVWSNAPFETGAAAHRPYLGGDGRPSTGWQAEFGDVDNDGRDDLFVAKGNVDQMPSNAMADPNNLLMGQADGSFVEAGEAAGLASLHRSRGASLVDLNADGRLDVVVVNRRAPLEVQENVTGGAGSWLEIDLRQSGVNTRMTGGWIEARGPERTWVREMTIGGGHAGGQAGFQHFGLGDLDAVEVRIVAPGGGASEWTRVAANQRLLALRDGQTGVVTFKPVVAGSIDQQAAGD